MGAAMHMARGMHDSVSIEEFSARNSNLFDVVDSALGDAYAKGRREEAEDSVKNGNDWADRYELLSKQLASAEKVKDELMLSHNILLTKYNNVAKELKTQVERAETFEAKASSAFLAGWKSGKASTQPNITILPPGYTFAPNNQEELESLRKENKKLTEENNTLETILDNVHRQQEYFDEEHRKNVANILQEMETLKQEHMHEIAMIHQSYINEALKQKHTMPTEIDRLEKKLEISHANHEIEIKQQQSIYNDLANSYKGMRDRYEQEVKEMSNIINQQTKMINDYKDRMHFIIKTLDSIQHNPIE
jgi:hypothetical protein